MLWEPAGGAINPAGLEGIEGVVHLSGENIASGRWTTEKKQRLLDSRINTTDLLCRALAQLAQPPRVLVSASAIGYYGDQGDAVLDETAAPGHGFLADICQQWENATAPAAEAGIRVANVRIGAVLDPAGGLLGMMLRPFKLGLGGVIGPGTQYMSWITRDDVVGAFVHCLEMDRLSGPVNGMTPQPVTNREFTKALGAALHRPTLFPMPAFAVKVLFGEMGENLMLASTRAVPRRLEETGYQFRHPDIETALADLL